jgi:trehalose 6-phosphate synthase/phosphatase
VIALYRAADVMLVTPTRDGMNLVAKEFAAARTDGDGVLVLSEFAGAADEMFEALQVNPVDVDGMAAAIEQALDMPEEERRSRMAGLRARVQAHDVHRWADGFLATLEQPVGGPPRDAPELTAAQLGEALRGARRVALLLDYDGTLVPLAARPELAPPDDELLRLLADLAKQPGMQVHVVSGRPRDVLERWLGALNIGLHAEHGVFSRADGAWHMRARIPEELRTRVQATLEHVARCTPGSFVEVKAVSLAFHYRQAEPEHGAHQARELRLHLREQLAGTPLEVLPGDKVVEVRPQGIHKGLAIRDLLGPGDRAVAFGDDPDRRGPVRGAGRRRDHGPRRSRGEHGALASARRRGGPRTAALAPGPLSRRGAGSAGAGRWARACRSSRRVRRRGRRTRQARPATCSSRRWRASRPGARWRRCRSCWRRRWRSRQAG